DVFVIVTTPPGKCPTCGEKILPSIGECLYCPPPGGQPAASPPARPPVPAAPPPPATAPAPRAAPTAAAAPPPPSGPAAAPAAPPRAPADDSAFGLLLFEAEECLARGHAEKAVVHASK